MDETCLVPLQHTLVNGQRVAPSMPLLRADLAIDHGFLAYGAKKCSQKRHQVSGVGT